MPESKVPDEAPAADDTPHAVAGTSGGATEPADDAWFAGGGRLAILEDLVHLVCYGPPLLRVAGVRGSGRTRLLSELVDHLRERRAVAVLHASSLDGLERPAPDAAGAAVAGLLVAAFSVPPVLAADGGADPDAVDVLRAWLNERDGAVLMLDDADRIARDRLVALLHGVIALPGLRLVAFTDVVGPASEIMSAEPFDSSATSHTLHLPPFDAAASEAFLAHRFGARLGLLKPRLANLHRRSHGIPGLLEVLALDELERQRTMPTWMGLPRMHVIAIAAVLASLIGLLTVDRVLPAADSEQGQERPEPQRLSVSSNDAAVRDTDTRAESAAPRQPPLQGVGVAPLAPATTDSTAPDMEAGAVPVDQVDVTAALREDVARVDVEQVDPAADGLASATANDSTDSRRDPRADRPDGAAAEGLGRESPPTGFTLQLAVLSTRENAIRYARAIGTDAHVRRRERGARSDYVVHWGRFASRAGAAAANLPDAAAGVSPWVRARADLFTESTPLDAGPR